ncbi:MAG: energy transducer TonB, partial [Thiobacillus sp.]|nr:energy transducer TonB [Thiobacillus sp.]
MSRTFEEPTIPAVPARVQRPLLALWISLALHAAVIGLVRVAPPGGTGAGGPVIEARLMPAPTTP